MGRKKKVYTEEELAKKKAEEERKAKETKKRVAFTDMLKAEYEKRGINPNFPMMMQQTKNFMEEYKYTIPSIHYTLWYMLYVLNLELFNYEQGSILNLVPYYHDEAKKYYNDTVRIKKEFANFEQTNEKRTVSYNPKPVKRLLNITFDD